MTVPAFARALRKALPGDLPGHPTGPETFLLAIIKTTAAFGRTAASHFEEEERGILGTCAGLGPQSAQEGEPRTFYAPETGAPKLEPGLVEGETFIDVSDGCGSNKGSGWNFSLYLTGRDPSTPVQIIDRKIPGLRLAFNSLSSFIANPVASELDGELADAEAAFGLFRTSGAASGQGRDPGGTRGLPRHGRRQPGRLRQRRRAPQRERRARGPHQLGALHPAQGPGHRAPSPSRSRSATTTGTPTPSACSTVPWPTTGASPPA